MRHIPEEELHAYLDQALSRSQCVEIECHLAACIRCRHERDQIAAVRDRTTALLGMVSPAGRPRPSFAELTLEARGRHAESPAAPPEDRSRAAAWGRHGLQAAGVALAVALGWSARGMLTPPMTGISNGIQQFVSGPRLDQFGTLQPQFGSILPGLGAPASRVQPEPDPSWQPDPVERAPIRVPAQVVESTVEPLALTVSTLEAGDGGGDFPTSGVWRTVSWSEAAALAGDAIPRIEGMPVVEIQVQKAGPEERPVLMVTHQDPSSGMIVRSIEGPADRLGDMLAGVIERTDGAMRTSQPLRTGLDYVGGAGGTPRRSLRVVALAARLEADSLNALTRLLTLR